MAQDKRFILMTKNRCCATPLGHAKQGIFRTPVTGFEKLQRGALDACSIKQDMHTVLAELLSFYTQLIWPNIATTSVLVHTMQTRREPQERST